MRNTRVKGHTLCSEGTAFYSKACSDPNCRHYQETYEQIRADFPTSADEFRVRGQFEGGHARCSCGAESEHLPSQGARRRWHAAHKNEVALW